MPDVERPHMPQYGVPQAAEGLLPWSWAEERLTRSHNYWVATTRPDARPHVTAVWGLWLDETFCFSAATDSRKIRNLRANPACSVTTERADEAVIVEGAWAELTDEALLARFKAEYKTKYDWDIDAVEGGVYVVRPSVAFGFIEHDDQFAQTATRWRF